MQMQRGARGFSFVAVQQGPDEIPAVSQSCEQMFTTMQNYEGIHKILKFIKDDYLMTCHRVGQSAKLFRRRSPHCL